MFAPDPTPAGQLRFVYVRFPGDLDPVIRHAQFGDPLDAKLQLEGLGSVTGGGSFFAPGEDEDGEEEEVLFCGLDCDVTDVTATRALLRLHLPELGCPAGTRIEFTHGDMMLADEYDGTGWLLDLSRDPHPAFGT